MGATVGLLHLQLRIPQAGSLKDKRRAVKSFKDRVRHGHNVSVAEVDYKENYRMALLAVAMTGDDRRYIEGGLQKIQNAAANHRDMILIESTVEWF